MVGKIFQMFLSKSLQTFGRMQVKSACALTLRIKKAKRQVVTALAVNAYNFSRSIVSSFLSTTPDGGDQSNSRFTPRKEPPLTTE